MFELAGDLGLQHEPGATVRIIGLSGLNFLEGHLAIQLGIHRHRDLSDPAASVGTEHMVPASVRGRRDKSNARRPCGSKLSKVGVNAPGR
jgi:hypothetical protein